ncbi:G-protein coupled receptor Mth2-like [Penaeus japonicus]|uniref:G-protein coupled receptor Mth2-like n=1 Tax=Penaeus japonicus TaxID=27405 RepID=UPI001C710513|nr:G-protein coupled receptor Mth2-like [Penaeus japonicus]XP_042874580.1 G-protein coupled receptor Mth2-like [Penaeus japonicus]
MHHTLWMLVVAALCSTAAATTLPPQPPQPPQPPAPNPANLTLRKCLCGGGQIWDGSQCVDKEESLVSITDHITGLTHEIDSSDFGQVITEQVTCPDLREPAVLRDEDQVLLTTNDRAHWKAQNLLFVKYCVEHTPEMEFRVCLRPPAVPRCCLPGHVLEKNGSCTPRDAVEFSPPVYLRATGEPLHFRDANAVDAVEDVRCEGLAVPYEVDLSAGNDFLLYNADKAALIWLPPSEYASAPDVTTSYCVGLQAGGSLSEEKYVAKVCYTDLAKVHRHTCNNATCVRKCCPSDQLFGSQACFRAGSAEEIWHPSVHFNKSMTPQQDISDDLVVVNGQPLCKHFYVLKPDKYEKDKHFLLANGSLHLPAQRTYHADKYCLDLQVTTTGVELITIVCSPTPEKECEWNDILILVLLCISCVFLFATLVVYISVAELRDRTNGRCLISMVAAMLATYVSIVVNREIRDASDGECLTMGFVGHVCSLATFFWLNVMCFDMWSTLRSSKQKYQSVKVFVFYSIYAWGCPLLIGLIGLILDLLKLPNVIRPNFTMSSCWFYGDVEFWTYLSGIILVLLVVNLFFFIHVAITLARKLKQRNTLFDNNESRASNATKKNKEQVWLFVRLFIVMGVVWVTEILSSLHRGSCSYWVLTDILNSLQGVFIFGVAVCNKDNIKKIKHSWRTRYTTVRSKVSTLRGPRQSDKTSQAKRITDLSVAASEASRKTSVTSLPRKISTASNNWNNRLTDQSLNSEATTAPRKISTASNLEMIPMSSMEE